MLSHPVCCCSVAQSFLTLCDPMDRSTLVSLSVTNSWRLLKVSDAIQPPHPLLSPSSLAFNLSQSGCLQMSQLFTSGGQSIGVSASVISPSSEHSRLILFRMDWLDLCAVQGTLKSLLQHHSSKASIPPCSAFFIVRLSHPYLTTGKTIALTRQTFVDKVMSLLFNTLFAFTMAFLLRSKHLLISWLQSSSTVILEPKKIKSLAVSTLSPSICHEVIGPDAMISVFEC